jgi:hypothetical protein
MPLAIFGIDNTGINLGITFAILALFAIWIALIVFTYSDARRRISDPFLVGCSTAASLFPFVGTIIYTILRPPEFLEDVNERDTEMKASETRLRHLDAHSCRKCGFPTETDFVRCPACRSKLKDPCPSCTRPVGLNWKVCPYCEHTLIASKRSKAGSEDSPRKSSDGRRRSKRKAAAEGEQTTRAEASSKESSRSDSQEAESGRRRGRRAARSEAAPSPESRDRSETRERPVARDSPETRDRPPTRDRSESSESSGSSDGSDRAASSDRPARDATRSGRRRTVISDDDEDSLSTKTINGGDSDSSRRSLEDD